jgi:predicted dehydrogenase
MPPFRLAFIGLDHPHGAGWRKALANLGEAVKITAIVPRFGGATASLEERHTDAARFETVAELIARGQFDGAMVCLPNHEGPAAIAALATAGKHVLAEKPAAACVADFQSAAQTITAAGVAFQSGYMWRYDPLANRLREMVRDGRFGKLISVEMLYVTSNVARRGPDHYLFDPAASGGGFFNWLACHWLDLLLYITGEPVVGVTARVGNFAATPVDVEDGGTAIFDLAGGGIATFTGGYWLPRWAGESHWCLRGRDRWVHWDPGRAGTGGVLEIHGPQPQFDAMNETFAQPVDTTPGYGGMRAVDCLNDWISAARQGGRPCRNTPQSTRDTLALIDTIYEASRQGRRIECRIGER